MKHEEVKRRLLENPEMREAYEHPPLALAVARAVVLRRRELGISQEDLAQQLGTSQTQVWRIESGQANITLETLQKLGDILHIAVPQLVTVYEVDSLPPSSPYQHPAVAQYRGSDRQYDNPSSAPRASGHVAPSSGARRSAGASRSGQIAGRSHVSSSKASQWTKRTTETGRAADMKSTKPFKGVRKKK